MLYRKIHQKNFVLIIFGIIWGIFLSKLSTWINNSGKRATRNILPRDEEFLFVGGVPRSGTTIMRVMLDIHPEIRCGEETVVIPEILDWLDNFENSFLRGLKEAGITSELMDDAMSAFLSEIIQKHAPEESVLCNKDPIVLMYMERLNKMFPRAKFLLMLRDPRGTVKSLNDLGLTGRWGFGGRNLTQNFITWNGLIANMVNQCIKLGSLCLMIHYEKLILDTKTEIQRILEFIEVPFDEKMLNHEKYMGTHGENVQLAENMFRLDQVTQKIYKDKLYSWTDFYPKYILDKLHEIAPMMNFIGYDSNTTMPTYEELPIICNGKKTSYNGAEQTCETKTIMENF